jgi:hypothetical protein
VYYRDGTALPNEYGESSDDSLLPATFTVAARPLWKWVVLVGLLAVMLEWWVYNKRVQI